MSLLIRKTLDSCKDENYIYQCITFNYTKCIGQVWKTLRASETGRHNTVGARHKEFSGNVLHIHGTLEDNEMIAGVNDEKQISNSSLAQNIHVKWALIKPYLNQAIGQNKTQKAQKIIDHSAIVCVYDMSLCSRLYSDASGPAINARRKRKTCIFKTDGSDACRTECSTAKDHCIR